MKSSPDGTERRAHARFMLKAFGFEHFCTLRAAHETAGHKARLIDLSRGGARCRLENGAMYQGGDAVILDSALTAPGFALTGLSAVVRWSADGSVGLQFADELPIGVAELQRMLTP